MNGAFLAHAVARDLVAKFLEDDEPKPEEITLDQAQILECCGSYSAVLDDVEISLEHGLYWPGSNCDARSSHEGTPGRVPSVHRR